MNEIEVRGMSEQHDLPQVGAPDPELKNSPIAEEMDEDSPFLRLEVPGEPGLLLQWRSLG